MPVPAPGSESFSIPYILFMLYMIVVCIINAASKIRLLFYSLLSLENFTFLLVFFFLSICWCFCFCFAMFNGAYDYYMLAVCWLTYVVVPVFSFNFICCLF